MIGGFSFPPREGGAGGGCRLVWLARASQLFFSARGLLHNGYFATCLSQKACCKMLRCATDLLPDQIRLGGRETDLIVPLPYTSKNLQKKFDKKISFRRLKKKMKQIS